MKIQIRYFASLREALGTPQETWTTQVNQVSALRAELVARGGAYAEALAQGRPVRVAVNQVMVAGDAPLIEGAEVAFFPPVTGG